MTGFEVKPENQFSTSRTEGLALTTDCANSFHCQSEPNDGRIAASCLTDPE